MCADRIKNIKRPSKMGLYDPQFEKDSCGVGLVANIKGIPSREIMEDAYIINFITIEKIGKARIQKVKDSKLLEKVINKTFSYS